MYRGQELQILVPIDVAQLLTAQARRIEDERILVAEAKKCALENERKARHKRDQEQERAVPAQPGPGEIEIVSVEQLAILDENVEAMESITQKAAMPIYRCLTGSRGRFRSVPKIDPRLIAELVSEFENMAEPIAYLSRELELMAHLPPEEFQITPILLLGSPGIGKTAFAGRLAEVLGLPYSKVNGGEASFSLTGSHPSYTKAMPGNILKQIAMNNSACPVILVDEIDKPSGERYPLSNALLDLLEPINAINFKDEFFQFSFNASKAIWILTANSATGVSEPLLSRVAAFDIPTPDEAQRKRLIETSITKLCCRTGHRTGLDPGDVTTLARRLDLDLRMLTRLVRNAFIDALRDKSDQVRLTLPRAARTGIGFY